MPASNRALILAALLAIGVIAQVAGAPSPDASPRWPPSSVVFDVAGWSTDGATIDRRAGTVFISRRYMSSDGRMGAVLALATSTDAKSVYRAGPEVPFSGAGYAVGTAAEATTGTRAESFVATRGRDRVIVFAVHGERRGLVGNGLTGWALATLDGVLGRQNDYFEATLVLPVLDANDDEAIQAGTAFADQVFAQIADWYAR